MRRRRRAVRTLVVALAVSAAAAPPAAGRALEDVRRRGALSVCAPPNALPFASKRGSVRGLQIDLAEEIARRMGVGLAVEWVTEAVMYRRVDCDAVMDAIVAEGVREEGGLTRSTPYHRTGVALALPPGRAGVARFDGLGPGARIGVMFGSLAQTRLGERGLKVIPFGFEDELVAAVASGEVDAAAATPTSIGWFNKGRPDRALAVAHAYDHEPELAWELAVGLRRSDPPMRREVDRIVAAMLADGAFARIYAAYGIEHRPPAAGRRGERSAPLAGPDGEPP